MIRALDREADGGEAGRPLCEHAVAEVLFIDSDPLSDARCTPNTGGTHIVAVGVHCARIPGTSQSRTGGGGLCAGGEVP